MTGCGSLAETIAKHWDSVPVQQSARASKWWTCRQILRHQNRLVCGEPIDGFAAGLRRRVTDLIDGRTLSRGRLSWMRHGQ